MKYVFTLVFATAFLFSAFSQAETIEAADEAILKDGPVLTFNSEDPMKPVVDYGQVEQGSDPIRTISFTNTGNEPLIVSNARGSCGCTVPTWPKEPIMPGESSEIKIRYDTKRLGPITKTVKLTTNDAVGTHLIRLEGKVNAKAQEENVPKKSSIFENQNNN